MPWTKEELEQFRTIKRVIDSYRSDRGGEPSPSTESGFFTYIVRYLNFYAKETGRKRVTPDQVIDERKQDFKSDDDDIRRKHEELIKRFMNMLRQEKIKYSGKKSSTGKVALALVVVKAFYRCIGAETKLFAELNGRLVHSKVEYIFAHDGKVRLPRMKLEDGSLEWIPVEHWEKRWSEVFAITFSTGHRVLVSPEHQWILCKSNSRTQNWFDSANLKRTDELEVGDFVPLAMAISRPSFDNAIYGYSAGYYVGAYLAEGSKGKRQQCEWIQLSLGNDQKDKQMVRKLEPYIAGDLHERFHAYPSANKISVSIHGFVAKAIIDKFVVGKSAWTKRLKSAVWEQKLDFLEGILDGFLDGDGCPRKKQGGWSFNICANRPLTDDLVLICRLLNYAIRYRPYPRSKNDNHFINGNRVVGGDHILGWVRKDRTLEQQNRRFGIFGYTRVNKIEKLPKLCKVFDVTLGGDGLLVLGSGIVTHNSNYRKLEEVPTPSITVETQYKVPMTKEEWQIVLDGCEELHNDRLRTWILCDKECGMSPAELLAITGKELSERFGTINEQLRNGQVPVHIRIIRGKTKSHGLGFYDTFIGEEGVDALQKFLPARPRKFFPVGDRQLETDFVKLTETINKQLTELQHKGANVSLWQNFTPKSCRKFFSGAVKFARLTNPEWRLGGDAFGEYWQGHSIARQEGAYIVERLRERPEEMMKVYMEVYPALKVLS